jgi:hypothetical protein
LDAKKKIDYSFSVIKHRGDPKSATTLDGHRVEKVDKVYIPEWKAWVRCADYHGEHFVYLDPEAYKGHKGRWFAMCTCGGPAVIIGETVYKTSGGMLACMLHAQYGRHATSDGRTWS